MWLSIAPTTLFRVAMVLCDAFKSSVNEVIIDSFICATLVSAAVSAWLPGLAERRSSSRSAICELQSLTIDELWLLFSSPGADTAGSIPSLPDCSICSTCSQYITEAAAFISSSCEVMDFSSRIGASDSMSTNCCSVLNSATLCSDSTRSEYRLLIRSVRKFNSACAVSFLRSTRFALYSCIIVLSTAFALSRLGEEYENSMPSAILSHTSVFTSLKRQSAVF